MQHYGHFGHYDHFLPLHSDSNNVWLVVLLPYLSVFIGTIDQSSVHIQKRSVTGKRILITQI